MADPTLRRTARLAADEDFPEPPRLRHLRWLINALTMTLILGVVAIVVLLAIRLPRLSTPLALPDAIVLPAGERAGAVTFGGNWVALVTEDGSGTERIRVFDRATGASRGVTRIAPAASSASDVQPDTGARGGLPPQ